MAAALGSGARRYPLAVLRAASAFARVRATRERDAVGRSGFLSSTGTTLSSGLGPDAEPYATLLTLSVGGFDVSSDWSSVTHHLGFDDVAQDRYQEDARTSRLLVIVMIDNHA